MLAAKQWVTKELNKTSRDVCLSEVVLFALLKAEPLHRDEFA